MPSGDTEADAVAPDPPQVAQLRSHLAEANRRAKAHCNRASYWKALATTRAAEIETLKQARTRDLKREFTQCTRMAKLSRMVQTLMQKKQ